MAIVSGDDKGRIRILDSSGYVKCLFNYKEKIQTTLHHKSNLYTVYNMMLSIFSSGIFHAESSRAENYFRIVSRGFGYCYLYYDKKDSNSSPWVIANCQTNYSLPEGIQFDGY